MGLVSWRTIYFASIGLRFVLALSNSYIHPDEHFQGLEVLAGRLFQVSSNEPWEFTLLDPARSYAPLLLIYYIPLNLARWLELLPMQTWYLVRLVFMVVSWVVTDWCLYKMLPTKQERIKAIYFALTSFISLVYQSHTFSNLIETVLVVVMVYFINELRFMRSLPLSQYTRSEVIYYASAIGLVFALGIFNRVTFPVFFVLPAFFYLQCSWKWPYLCVISFSTFLFASAGCIVTDTVWFGKASLSAILNDPWNWTQYVVTPYNNLIYNSTMENLSQHGIHPFYTHIVVNLPQIMGPGLVLLLPRFKNSYWRTTPFLAAVSGILCLSVVPHQELRFLIPAVPLLCACFDVASAESAFKSKPWVLSLVMNSWLLFNGIMALIMGVLHQGGVVPALDFLHENTGTVALKTAFIWWRTYSPPTWMYNEKKGNLQIVSLGLDPMTLGLQIDPSKNKLSVDAMGTSIENLNQVIQNISKNYESVYLVTPVASFKQHIDASLYTEIWSYSYHLDMDHLDFSSIQSLQPGISIYSLL